jgi:O-antigen ligase
MSKSIFKKYNKLDLFFNIQLVLFTLIITSILPRETALYLGVALIIYFLLANLDDILIFFIRSIPLFLAIPVTNNFDGFNIWRILVVIIFFKWFLTEFPISKSKFLNKFSISNLKLEKHNFLLMALLLLAVLSIIPALDKIAAIKRIIFFSNFVILGIVIYHKTSDKHLIKRLIKNSIIPVIIVAFVGYIQLISTYFVDIYKFMRIWGEGIQCRQFGNQWCNIAVWLGNTWFAYYGEQLSLRVFSLFPDSHSFPQFILLGIPAILVFINKKLIKITLAAFLFLITILSGTRGIWAASIGVVILYFGIFLFTKKMKNKFYNQSNLNNLGNSNNSEDSNGIIDNNIILLKQVGWYLAIFFLMFGVAFPIFSSPQFLVSKSDDFLQNRVRSIIDLGETSNAQRIDIWKRTLISIKERPLLGVGIGNYPVVLEQDVRLAKAGSSAHNLYLHIAAEMGILASIIFICFLWLFFKKNYKLFIREKDEQLALYFSSNLLFVPWILFYSLTDIAIFDERTFLFILIPISIILGIKNNEH